LILDDDNDDNDDVSVGVAAIFSPVALLFRCFCCRSRRAAFRYAVSVATAMMVIGSDR